MRKATKTVSVRKPLSRSTAKTSQSKVRAKRFSRNPKAIKDTKVPKGITLKGIFKL